MPSTHTGWSLALVPGASFCFLEPVPAILLQVWGAELFIFPQRMPGSPTLGWQGHTLVTCPQSVPGAPGPHPLMSRADATQAAPVWPAQVRHRLPHPEARQAARVRHPWALKRHHHLYTMLRWTPSQPPTFLHWDMLIHTKQNYPLNNSGQIKICHQMGHERIQVFRAFYNLAVQ